MIDYHCHLLPNLDDGSRTIVESLLMAKKLANSGFTTVYCTPHHIPGLYDTTFAQVEAGVSRLRHLLAKEAIPLQLKTGMEYYVDEFFSEIITQAQPLEGTDLLLFEIPPACPSSRLILESIRCIKKHGFRPLLAHPERCFYPAAPTSRGLFRRRTREVTIDQLLTGADDNPVSLQDLVDSDCLLQGNIGSFSRAYGKSVQVNATRIANQGQYYCFGTDGHRIEQIDKVLQGLDAVNRLSV